MMAGAGLRHAFSGIRDSGRRVARLALDIALPTLCVACREPVAGAGVCPACWNSLTLISPPFCPRLGIPFEFDPGEGVLSAQALMSPPAYGRARAVTGYDDVAKALVHGLKFQDRADLAPIMGRWMARAGQDILQDNLREAAVLVPVPLHWRRGFGRRFNQADLLARAIAVERGLKVMPHVLKRVRRTEQQAGLSRAARAQNVQAAFAVPEEHRPQIAGRAVVLVDDVLTTGATLEACARAVLRAGAASADVLVFARVVDSRDNPI